MRAAFSRRRSCLVVEDEPLIGADLEEMIGAAGYDVHWAAALQGAFTRIGTQSFDVAIIDFRSHNGNAADLARALRRLGIPFIVHGGSELNGGPADMLGASWLTKPADRAVILGALDAVRRISRWALRYRDRIAALCAARPARRLWPCAADAETIVGTAPSSLYGTEPRASGYSFVVSNVQGAGAREISGALAPSGCRAMVSRIQRSVRNRLLKAMSATDFALIEPHLVLVPAPARTVLIAPDLPIAHLYFPEQGFTSITIDGRAGPVEVAMIGREGLVGASPLLLGVDRTPHQSFVQMSGENLRIAAADFQVVVTQSASMQVLLLRYLQALIVQMAQTVFTNAVCDIECRLARWVLMCQDRVDDQDINITHEFLSMMLGVRRAGVTVAIQVLEGKNLIKATRGHVKVLNRAGLLAEAHDSYGSAEAEYSVLIDGRPSAAALPAAAPLVLTTGA